MSKKKATSSDVAKRAGVSQATVSMVLNKKYNVSFSRETVEKVEQAARDDIILLNFILKNFSSLKYIVMNLLFNSIYLLSFFNLDLYFSLYRTTLLYI